MPQFQYESISFNKAARKSLDYKLFGGCDGFSTLAGTVFRFLVTRFKQDRTVRRSPQKGKEPAVPLIVTDAIFQDTSHIWFPDPKFIPQMREVFANVTHNSRK